jgi:manganese/iron transport system substrate-binding protein
MMRFNPHSAWKVTVLSFTVGLLAGCGASTSTSQTSPTAANPAATATPTAATNRQGLSVAATTTILCDLTKRIAADTVKLNCLLKPGVDAHIYEPLPEDRKAIETAKLVLYSGYDLEPTLIKLIQATSNPAVKVVVAELAVPKPLMGEAHDHGHGEEQAEEEHDQEAGDEQVPDPHVWQSAENGMRMAEVIQRHLAKLVPDNATLYAENAQTLKAELTQIHSWIRSQIATIPVSSRKLITTHDALGYFAAAYNIPVEGALQGISTEEKPTASRVKTLVDQVKAAGVPTIFVEVVVNPKLIQGVARDAKVKIADRSLFSDSLGEAGSGGETYPQMLIANTQTIVEGLGGQYTAFKLAQ